tara:strand:- start:6280 stop:6996 length:717 start_codon:yes stop_codon:yes gene_type:complete
MNDETESTEENQETIEVPQEYADSRPEWLPEKFNSPEDLADSYANLESKIGQKEEELRQSFMEEMQAEAFADRPAEVGDYLLPEIIDEEEAVDNELLNWWADHSFENGYSQDEFQKGIEMFYEATNDEYNPESEMAQLGDNAQERVEAVGLFVENQFPEEVRGAIDELCSTAEGIRAVEIIMDGLKENTVAGNSQPTALLNEDKLKEMMNDPRYWNVSKRDPAFISQVDNGFKKLYNR